VLNTTLVLLNTLHLLLRLDHLRRLDNALLRIVLALLNALALWLLGASSDLGLQHDSSNSLSAHRLLELLDRLFHLLRDAVQEHRCAVNALRRGLDARRHALVAQRTCLGAGEVRDEAIAVQDVAAGRTDSDSVEAVFGCHEAGG
jgi:hypothetical protein